MKAVKTPSLPVQNVRWWSIPRQAQIIAAVVVAVALGLRAQWYLVDQVDLSTGLWWWGFAGAFFLFALWQARETLFDGGMSEAVEPAGKFTLERRTEMALFAAVLGVGIFFRFYRVGDIPPGLNHDAAWEGLYAIRINQGIDYAPFVNCCGSNGRETMFLYIIAAFQRLVGFTVFATQLAALSVGIATLIVFYLLMRRMFDTRVALVATLILGVSGWHITFSRLAWRAILAPLFLALACYLLLRALESRRIRDFLLAGVALGLSLDTYEAARTIPLGIGVFLLYLLMRNRSLIWTHFRGFAAYGVAALAAFAPLGWYALHNWEGFSGRGQSLWIGSQIEQAGSWEPLWRNIGDGLLIFNFRAHGDDFFTREPLLDAPVAVFFVLGLAYSLTRLKRPEHLFLLIMLVFSLLNGFLSEPNGNRALGAVVPVAAYAGLFLVVAWRWLQQALPRLAPYSTLGLAAVLALSAYSTFNGYLGPNRRVQWGFYPETTRVGRYVKTIADDYEVHLVAGNWPRDALTYLSYSGKGDPFQWRYTYTSNADEVLTLPASTTLGTAFVIESVSRYESAFDFLRARYPSATLDHIYYPDGSETVIANVLLVPPGAAATTGPPAEAGPPEPTVVAPGAAERDAERRTDLTRLAFTLAGYKAQEGSYPSTSGNLQSACVYEEDDVLCRFKADLGKETFVDPFGDPFEYGYWYASDGTTFTLYALLESPPAPGETCEGPGDLADKANLYCLRP